jgi:2,5-diketo-D-gluconate reductase A
MMSRRSWHRVIGVSAFVQFSIATVKEHSARRGTQTSRVSQRRSRCRRGDNDCMTSPADVPAVTLPSGAQMPMVGFGTWQLRSDRARDAVLAALAAGYRHIDTATMYKNEEAVGEAVRDSGLDRGELFITTKIRPADAGKEPSVLRGSLRKLGTDYLDLWLQHWPSRSATNRQLWQEMLRLQADGYVRDIGVSNYSTAQLDEVITSSGRAPAVNQVHWNPARYDATVLADHAERGIAVEGYSPLKDTRLGDPVLTRIAAGHGVTPAQVVLRWHLEHDITVIPKSAHPDRIAANIDLAGFRLTAGEMAAIDGLARR